MDARPGIASSPPAWRTVQLDGHSFIYTQTGTLVCMVPKQAGVRADFIVRACRHHDELVRLLQSAVNILSDGSEEMLRWVLASPHVWPENSAVRVQKFFTRLARSSHER